MSDQRGADARQDGTSALFAPRLRFGVEPRTGNCEGRACGRFSPGGGRICREGYAGRAAGLKLRRYSAGVRPVCRLNARVK